MHTPYILRHSSARRPVRMEQAHEGVQSFEENIEDASHQSYSVFESETDRTHNVVQLIRGNFQFSTYADSFSSSTKHEIDDKLVKQ